MWLKEMKNSSIQSIAVAGILTGTVLFFKMQLGCPLVAALKKNTRRNVCFSDTLY